MIPEELREVNEHVYYSDEAGWGTFKVPKNLEIEFMEFIHRYEMTDDWTDEELDRWEEYRIE